MRKVGISRMSYSALRSRKNEQGAVSLFVVVFCALLMTVLTISFIRIMVQEQQQAAANDLSQSAYDSAQAGVEDAKRALLLCQRGSDAVCATLDRTTDTCESVPDALSGHSGSMSASPETGNKEMKIQTSSGDEKLDQAYTCVKVDRTPDEYPGSLDAGASKIIPLKTGGETFDRVRLSWFAYDDLKKVGITSRAVSLSATPSSSVAQLLPASNNTWPKNRPSLMRAQLMQFDSSGFTLDSFNSATGDDKSNANTVFLYPTRSAAPGSANFIDDKRQEQDNVTGGGRLNTVRCKEDFDAAPPSVYACSIDIVLPEQINTTANGRTAYLRLSGLYNATSYSVTLLRGTETVPFDGVIAKIDATGRANDLFRRVESTVELEPINFPYPEAAVDISGNLCKNFVVTDGTGPNSGYSVGSCTP